jgi:nicotinate-nucleotide adenylyltransferase
MKTGILGGTFNPIHLAHLRIAEEVHQTLELDRTLFIPAAEPPHKNVAGEIAFAHRLAMVEAAIKDYPAFQASDLELHRSGKSFSVDTLDYFIIGLDSYRDIASWKNFSRIFSLSHLVVTTRPGVVIKDSLEPLPVAMHKDFCYDEEAKKLRHKSGNYLIFLEETKLDISSTQIRELKRNGQPIEHLVPAAVAAYIEENGLYRESPYQ